MPMPIRCNGVCCNNFVANPGYQSVEHNVRGLNGLVQAERRLSNTRCQQAWHCSLKVQIFLLTLDVRDSIECLFHSWGYGAAHYHIRHGIQHTLRDLWWRFHGIKTVLLHQLPIFLRITIPNAQNLRPLDSTSPIKKLVMRPQGRVFLSPPPPPPGVVRLIGSRFITWQMTLRARVNIQYSLQTSFYSLITYLHSKTKNTHYKKCIYRRKLCTGNILIMQVYFF